MSGFMADNRSGDQDTRQVLLKIDVSHKATFMKSKIAPC